jgi:hypothetical protein
MFFVIPAQAGIQRLSSHGSAMTLDPGLTSSAVEKRLAGMTSIKAFAPSWRYSNASRYPHAASHW